MLIGTGTLKYKVLEKKTEMEGNRRLSVNMSG